MLLLAYYQIYLFFHNHAFPSLYRLGISTEGLSTLVYEKYEDNCPQTLVKSGFLWLHYLNPG